MRGSLLDDVGYETIGKAKPDRARTSGGQQVKATLAVVLLVAAAGMIAWNYGLFSPARGAATVLTMQDKANMEVNEAVRRELQNKVGTEIGGE